MFYSKTNSYALKHGTVIFKFIDVDCAMSVIDYLIMIPKPSESTNTAYFSFGQVSDVFDTQNAISQSHANTFSLVTHTV